MRLGRFSFGVVDWENPVLLKEYYPQDLPADWRLDYYANEYPCVVVPADKWQDADEQQLRSWYEDAQGLLFFVFEVGDESRYPLIRTIYHDALLGFSDIPPSTGKEFQFISLSLESDAVVLVFLDMEMANDKHLKALKKQIEVLMESNNTTQHYLFIVRSENRQIELISSVKILLELLGYSV